MPASRPRICVIGAGTIGTWAAVHLAEAGADTTLLEQFPLPHTRGSSHGASRAFRFLGEETMHRLDYSLERWQALERGCGQEIFRRTGLLNFGPPGDPWLARHMAIAQEAGKVCDWLDAADIRTRFPLLNYPAEWGAAWDPEGGIVFAHRSVTAAQAVFRSLGGQLLGARASAVEDRAGAGVAVGIGGDAGRVQEWLAFDRAVVSCGPWTARLLPGLAAVLRTVAVPVTYWRDRYGGHGAADGFPILYNARLKGIYGLPACEYPELVKILYHGGPDADPEQRDVPGRRHYVDLVSAYVREHLPGLEWRQPAIEETCMYTISPDNEPIIDRLSEKVVVGCGFSGSGFKHSPATGRMLAALALGEEATLPAGFQLGKYSAARFSSRG